MMRKPESPPAAIGAAAALAIAVALIWPVTAAADQVRTRAWAHGQFGRIVFDWPSSVTYLAKISKGRLTVSFDRAIATSFEIVRRNLGRYIAEIALGEDGKSVVATLKRPVRVRSFVNKKAVVVDLIDVSAATSGGAETGPRRGAPKSARSKASAALPLLGIRTGEHLGFGRIVFDWTRSVVYNVGKSNGHVTIRFSHAARINLAKLKADLPNPLSGATTSLVRGGLAVRLAVPADARVRHFRDGSKVVLDILSGVGRGAPAKPRRRSAARPATPRNSNGAVSPQGAEGPLALVAAARRDSRPAVKRKRKRKPRLRRHAKRFGPQAAIVTVDAERSRNDLVITFNWRQPVAAVAYIRNRRLWLAFDAAARVALGPIRVKGKGIVERAEQYPQQGATLLGFSVPARYEARMTRDDVRWRLELKNRDPGAPKGGGLAVRTEAGPAGHPRLVLSVKSAAKPIRFRDPDVGDTLVAVALAEPGQHLAEGRSFVDFTLFPTIQGVVIRRISEEIHVRVDPSSIVISGPNGLNISPRNDISRHGAHLEMDRPLWNITAWQRGSGDDFERGKNELIGRVIESPPARRNTARIDLAKYYLSHGMAADTVGVVQTVMRQQPTAQQLDSLRALRGAASFLMRHYGDASADLNHRQLKDEAGVAPWLAAIAAERGDWRSANNGFTGTEQALARMPRWLAIRFNMMALEAALAVVDLERAKRLLETLQLEHLSPGKLAYLDLMRGYLFKLQKRPKKALEIWRALAESDDRLVRAKAAFARIETLRDLNEIEPAEALERLDKLSFAWRGDAFEFDLLRRLGQLHVAAKDYRRGLIRLRQAASYFENVEGADAVAKLMADYFKRLYLDGAADDLPPVRALALYDEFRELTPPGAEGERMVRRLADRLVKVDLLDEAAELLTHQIEFRLTGQQKARVAARLAEIRLLDQEPTLALAALKQSETADLPEELSRERRRIMARALGELKRPDEAIGVMAGDYGHGADRIRLGILWRAASWSQAADVIQRSMGFRGVEAGNDGEARRVLQWAVALAMLDDGVGLAALRDRFLADMSKSPFATPFRAIVGIGTDGAQDYNTLAKQIGDLDNLKTFMASFRQQVESIGQGAVN